MRFFAPKPNKTSIILKVFRINHMWKVLLSLVLLVSVSSASWFSRAKEDLEYSQKEGRAMAFYFYSSHCPYCAQMEEFVLSQEEVQKKLEGFVVISINISSDDESRWARGFGVPGVPTIVFYDPKQEKVLGALFGSRSKADVINFIQGICKRHNIKPC